MSDVKITISAKDNASKVFADVRSSMENASKAAGLLGSALGLVGIAGIGGLMALTRGVVDGIDAFNDLKDATGASIENISALDDVAARTGTSFDTVKTALVKFNGVLKDAKPGSEAERAMQALGLSIKELEGLDPAQALLKTSQALAGFADDGNKARITQELFGKSLKEVAPFLKDLAEAGQLNAKVTAEQADAAEKFNKQLFYFEKNSLDARRAIVNNLLPVVNDYIDALRLGIATQGGFLSAIANLGTTNAFNSLTENVKKYREELDKLSDLKSAKQASGWDTDAVDKDIATAKKRLDYFTQLRDLRNSRIAQDGDQTNAEARRLGLQGDRPSLPSLRVPKPIDDGKDKEKLTEAQRVLAAYVKGLEGLLETTEKLTEKQKALEFLKSLGATSDIAQVRELVLGQAELVDGLRAQEEAQKAIAEARKRSDAYFETIRKEQQALEDSNKTLSDHIEEIGLTTAALNELRLKRLDDAIAIQEQKAAQLDLQNSSEEEIAQFQRKIALLKEQRSLTVNAQIAQAGADSKTEQEKAAKDFSDTLRNDLKGAFSAAFRDTSGEPLKAFGDAIANVMYSRAATALADSLLGSATSSGGGTLLSSLFSFDGGGYTGTGARAGGLDGKGGFMAMLHPNETVLDHSKGQGAGQAITVVQNFTVGDVASVSLVRQAVAGSERRIAAAMGRSMNYGGALA